jgi:cell volume regulation protein A
MSEYADFFPQLALAVALLLTALAAVPFFERIRLPSPAAFLAVGIAAGLLDVAPTGELPIVTLEQIGAVALFVILFQGGLGTGFGSARAAARPILTLGLLGTIATAGGLALAAHYALGLDWSIALLVAVALAPTDPAAVYAVLRERSGSQRARTVLEGESGFNDPAGIALMVAVTAAVATSHASYGHSAWRFVEELAIGSAAGVAGGLILLAGLRVTRHLEDSIQAVAVVLAVVLLGAVAATLHGSGFLAVYVAGLLLSDAWARQDGAQHVVPQALSAVAEPLLFATLGAAFAPLVGLDHIGYGIFLMIMTVFVVRPIVASVCLIGSDLPAPDRALVSWGGLKGAVPLLLAGYPALEHFDEAGTVAAIVLVATAASLLVQGGTLPLVASRAVKRGAASSVGRSCRLRLRA